MSSLHFICKKCDKLFCCDVGKVTFPKVMTENTRPIFERDIICPHCGILTMDEVILPEEGQSELTEIYFNSS